MYNLLYFLIDFFNNKTDAIRIFCDNNNIIKYKWVIYPEVSYIKTKKNFTIRYLKEKEFYYTDDYY